MWTTFVFTLFRQFGSCFGFFLHWRINTKCIIYTLSESIKIICNPCQMLVFLPDLNIQINYIFFYNVQILSIYGSLYSKEHLYILHITKSIKVFKWFILCKWKTKIIYHHLLNLWHHLKLFDYGYSNANKDEEEIEVSRNPFLLKKCYIYKYYLNLSHFIAAAEEPLPDNRTTAGNLSTKKDRKRSNVLVWAFVITWGPSVSVVS